MPSPSPSRPILGVSTLVRRGDRVLLVQRGKPPYLGLWAFPGGTVEYGEALADAAAREVREETGLTVEIGAPLDFAEVLPRHESAGLDGHYVLVVFTARYVAGEPTPGDDAADARWFTGPELPPLETTAETARILLRHGPG